MESRVGILLLNSRLRPIHFNAEASDILGYPRKVREAPPLDVVLPATRSQLTKSGQAAPIAVEFASGRRRYVCRAFVLETSQGAAGRFQPKVVLVLERESKSPTDSARWSEAFQLTSRECQTVRLLLKGLTSKQIASEMSISPNTVKSFLKLAMAKVGASNRAGLVARIFERASLVMVSLLPITFSGL
jgi:DNA-binding CsgD family transcriptional regulator